MSISSKISVLYLLVVLFSIDQSVCTLSSEADEPPNLCKVKDQDGFELKLRATLLFRESLILIDHSWLVYQVPYSSMANSYSQLLIDIYAKPIEEYWPAFKTHESWPDMKPNVTSIFHVDMSVPYLYMVLTRNVRGVCYNIQTSTFDCDGPQYNGTEEAFITDNGPTKFSILKNDGHFELWNWNATWKENGQQDNLKPFSMGDMYYTFNRSTPSLKNISVIRSTKDPSKIISPDFNFSDLDWQLPPGFLYNGSFHLFDYRSVFTFPIAPLKMMDYSQVKPPINVRATNPVKITTVKDYFKCVHLKLSSNTYPPDQNSVDPGKSSYWIWIVVAIVMLLLIAAIALLVWYFMFNSKGKDSKSRKHSSGNTGRTRASSKKDNNFANKQRSSKQGNSKRKPSTQLSSKQGTSYASKQKPLSHKKK